MENTIDKKSEKPLTWKQKKFADMYVKHDGNAILATVDSYNCAYTTARSLSSKLLTDDRILKRIRSHLRKRTALSRSIQRIDEALDAANQEGEKDHNVRLKAAGMVLKLFGATDHHDEKVIKRLYLQRRTNVPLEELKRLTE